jgi:hypothetical protein
METDFFDFRFGFEIMKMHEEKRRHFNESNQYIDRTIIQTIQK